MSILTGKYVLYIKKNAQEKFLINIDGIDYIKNDITDNNKFEIFMKEGTSYVVNFELFSCNDRMQIKEHLLGFNVDKNKELINNINSERYTTVSEKLVNRDPIKEEQFDKKHVFRSKDSIPFQIFGVVVILSILAMWTLNLRFVVILFVVLCLLIFSRPSKLILNMDEKNIIKKNIIGFNMQKLSIPDMNKILVSNKKGLNLEMQPYTGKSEILKISEFEENEDLEILKLVSKIFNKELIFNSYGNNSIL